MLNNEVNNVFELLFTMLDEAKKRYSSEGSRAMSQAEFDKAQTIITLAKCLDEVKKYVSKLREEWGELQLKYCEFVENDSKEELRVKEKIESDVISNIQTIINAEEADKKYGVRNIVEQGGRVSLNNLISVRSEYSKFTKVSVVKYNTSLSTTNFSVKFSNGEIIFKKYAQDTFIDCIKGIGIGCVKRIELEFRGEPLLSNTKSLKYNVKKEELGDSLFLVIPPTTKEKYEVLKTVADILNIKLEINIYSSKEYDEIYQKIFGKWPETDDDSKKQVFPEEIREKLRKQKKGFSVKFPNGTLYCNEDSMDTMKKVVMKIGVAEVAQLGLKLGDELLLEKNKSLFKYPTESMLLNDGWYLQTHGTTQEIVSVFNRISAQLRLNLEIENFEGALSSVEDWLDYGLSPSYSTVGNEKSIKYCQITMPSGKIFKKSNVEDVFIESIKEFGAYKVMTLPILWKGEKLVSIGVSKKYPEFSARVTGVFFVLINSTDEEKISLLKQISHMMKIKAKIYVEYNNYSKVINKDDVSKLYGINDENPVNINFPDGSSIRCINPEEALFKVIRHYGILTVYYKKTLFKDNLLLDNKKHDEYYKQIVEGWFVNVNSTADEKISQIKQIGLMFNELLECPISNGS